MMEIIQTQTCWLAGFLDKAATMRGCTRVGCTTCGAMPFRKGLQKQAAMHAAARGLEDRGFIPAGNLELVRQLKMLVPDQTQERTWLDAVHLLFTDLAGGMIFGRVPESELSEELAGTWSGSVFEKMRRHHTAQMARWDRHERESAPDVIEARRAEKNRKTQEAHQARVAEKPGIDQRWFKKHPDDLARCLEIRRQRAARKAEQSNEQQNE